MRFNNDDYLKAFPRDERAVGVESKTIVKEEPGSVFDDQDENTPAGDPETEPEDAGGEDDGNE